MKCIHRSFFVLLVTLIVACSSIQQMQPKSARDSIAAGYVLLNSLSDAVRIAKRDELISVQARDNAVRELREALLSLTLAEGYLKEYESIIAGPADAAAQSELNQQINININRAQSILRLVQSSIEAS